MPGAFGELLRHVASEDPVKQEVDFRRGRSQAERRFTRSQICSG